VKDENQRAPRLISKERGARVTVRRRHKADEGKCLLCDEYRRKGEDFHPPHTASAMCESGKRSHCSCDRCF
jgi:hypothetical protein